MVSNNWSKNHAVVEDIEAIEDTLKAEYDKKRYNEERRALDRMDEDSLIFTNMLGDFVGREGPFPA